MTSTSVQIPEAAADLPRAGARPRLGFLGVGWIGRHRMEAIAKSGLAEIAAIADASESNADEALKIAAEAERVSSLEALLEMELDGVVIATPSALHAEQAIRALERGVSVFCQKPLARTAKETRDVICQAREQDLLLGVDLSYRFTTGMQKVRQIIRAGELGKVFAVDLKFHNAYGPDKVWFYDYKLAGGGCVIDLGIHLVDLAFWVLGQLRIERVDSRLYAGGHPLLPPQYSVEDFAFARIDLKDGASLNLSCSWKLQAGCDAIIEASFYGTGGGVQFHNVDGSFYAFRAERFRGTQREILSDGLEDWGARAALDWLANLARGERYNPEIEGLISVADTLDKIYGRS